MDSTPSPAAKPVESSSAADRDPSGPRESDEEILSWARKRGVVTFFFFFSIACIVAIVWTLTR